MTPVPGGNAPGPHGGTPGGRSSGGGDSCAGDSRFTLPATFPLKPHIEAGKQRGIYPPKNDGGH
eukprot:1960210-Ditylum_brightwellii.AAC.1